MVTPTGSDCARKLNAFIKGKVNSNELNLPVVAEFLHKLRLGFFDGELLTFTLRADAGGTDRLPAAHTCTLQLDMPWYESKTVLGSKLRRAMAEEGFGLA